MAYNNHTSAFGYCLHPNPDEVGNSSSTNGQVEIYLATLKDLTQNMDANHEKN